MTVTDAPRYVTLRDYLRVVRERRILVVVITLLFGGSGLLYSERQTPSYSAEASVQFRSGNQDTSAIGVFTDQGGLTPEQRAAVNASTLTRPAVLDRAAKKLGLESGDDLVGAVVARAEGQTQLVIVQGSATNAQAAANVANAVALAAVEVTRNETRDELENAADAQRKVLAGIKRRTPGAVVLRAQLQQEIATLEQAARIVEPAVVRREASIPTTPVSPKPVRTTLLGLLIGLTLGLVGAFVRDSLDRRFKNSHEITEAMHLPLLGHVSEDALGGSLVKAKGRKTLSAADLEGFRILRTNIEFLDVDNPPKLVLVTSALPEEGKSTIACGLGAAYSVTGKRTLIVECDLRRPNLAQRLGLNPSPGLTDYLIGNATPAQVLQTIAPLGATANGDRPADAAAAVPLVTITAGTTAPQPAELLRSKRCREFFEQVKDAYDVVIVDSPPLLSVADTLDLLPVTDAVVVCVRASKTTRDQARVAKMALAHFPERPSGVVVTGVRARDEAANYGYYSYGYVYGASSR